MSLCILCDFVTAFLVLIELLLIKNVLCDDGLKLKDLTP